MLTCSARKAPKWMKRVKYEQLRLGRIDPLDEPSALRHLFRAFDYSERRAAASPRPGKGTDVVGDEVVDAHRYLKPVSKRFAQSYGRPCTANIDAKHIVHVA